MDTLRPSWNGPFGLRCALRGRRLLAWLAVPLSTLLLGGLPHPLALAGLGAACGCVVWMAARMSGASLWGLVVDAAPAAWILAVVLSAATSTPWALLLGTLLGLVLLALWLVSFKAPRLPLAQLEHEAYKLALAWAAKGTPTTFVAITPEGGNTGAERGALLWVGDSANRPGSGARFVRLPFPVATDAYDGLVNPSIVRLWQEPTTAHARMAWAQAVARERAKRT